MRDYTPEWVDILDGMVAGAADAGIEVTYEDLLAFYAYQRMLIWPMIDVICFIMF